MARPVFGPYPYTLEAAVEGGLHPSVARTLLASGPRAIPERPRTSLHGRGRAEETTVYIWGPDANVLLEELVTR